MRAQGYRGHRGHRAWDEFSELGADEQQEEGGHGRWTLLG